MKRNTWALLALVFIFSACNDTVPAPDPTSFSPKKEASTTKEETKKDESTSQTQILNNISLQTKGGVEVYRAFLSDANGNLVPSDNTTSLSKPVYLNLNITKGWKEEMGKVTIGASEKITTDSGTVLLNEPDLFQNYTSISADDAKFIRLKAVINSMSGPIQYFIVDYKVWDKNGDGVISGSYKFYVQ